jgi:hypothetical protein
VLSDPLRDAPVSFVAFFDKNLTWMNVFFTVLIYGCAVVRIDLTTFVGGLASISELQHRWMPVSRYGLRVQERQHECPSAVRQCAF